MKWKLAHGTAYILYLYNIFIIISPLPFCNIIHIDIDHCDSSTLAGDNNGNLFPSRFVTNEEPTSSPTSCSARTVHYVMQLY